MTEHTTETIVYKVVALYEGARQSFTICGPTAVIYTPGERAVPTIANSLLFAYRTLEDAQEYLQLIEEYNPYSPTVKELWKASTTQERTGPKRLPCPYGAFDIYTDFWQNTHCLHHDKAGFEPETSFVFCPDLTLLEQIPIA